MANISFPAQVAAVFDTDGKYIQNGSDFVTALEKSYF